jgi:hypothetical protein
MDDKYMKLVTPKGVAKYPWLTKADTKFNPDGVYKTDLLLSSEDAKPLAAQIKEFYGKHFQSKKGKMPYFKETDDNEKETGNIIFRFKTKNKPALFDSDGKPMQNVNVFGGSQVKVSATAAPYNAAGNNGITLYLNAVQIIELVTGGGGDSDGFGFKAEEGYKHSGEITTDSEGSANDMDDF